MCNPCDVRLRRGVDVILLCNARPFATLSHGNMLNFNET